MGLFDVVVLDPPWQFDDRNTRGAAERHYPTMSFEEIHSLPLESITNPNGSHLFCWTTAAHLGEALQHVEKWGFSYKQYVVWTKTKAVRTELVGDLKIIHRLIDVEIDDPVPLRIGLGHYWRHVTEIALFATRGKGVSPLTHGYPNQFFAPLQEHSQKPELFQDMVERFSPGRTRLEIFARRERPGWITVGNEVATSLTSLLP